MKIFIVALFSIISCSSNDIVINESKYIQMNDLWKMNGGIEDVKKVFGNKSRPVESGIMYTYPNSNFPEMAFFFDSSNKLREQFVFLQEAALQELKKEINCKWKETVETRDIAHYQRTIKKGSCPELNITYETYLDLNAFELRWKR
jgi:hypothetical protein